MFILNENNSVANHFIAELRSVEIQKDSMRFRKNMERLGEILAYEISKKLSYESKIINTPLGKSENFMLQDQPVLATVLRAALPMYQGFLNFFDQAESAFIAAFRTPAMEDHSFEIRLDYLATPSLDGKILIIIDPMLATGKSLVSTYKELLKIGTPSHIHIATAIASRDGINYLNDNMENFTLWTAALDEELNSKYYIVPGLGDAGDLSFGKKL